MNDVSLPSDARLVADCARVASRIAPDLCASDLVLGGTCSWYHGFWPYLRALNVVTTPDSHGIFYAQTLEALAAQPDYRRVLICGSADFNMLQRTCAAFDAAGITPEVVFLDRCPTPVALADWYARRMGKTLDGRVGDILEFHDEPYDIVCTHSFMGYFDDEARQRLARRWAGLLRPGGKVVTINRVRPQAEPGLMGFTEEQAAQFVARVRDAAADLTTPLDADIETLAQAAALYARNFRIRPVRSIETLQRFFENNGFAIDRMDGGVMPGHEGKPASGPTTPDGANYIHMVATRR